MSAPLEYRTEVKPEWVDHNGHMNVACYVLAFDEATDDAYEQWGLGLGYPIESGCSVFTLGMNVDYLSELFADDAIRIETVLVDHDKKRIHYFHQMYNSDTGELAATNECLCMNVDLRSRKASPFPVNVLNLLSANLSTGERPGSLGRILVIRRK